MIHIPQLKHTFLILTTTFKYIGVINEAKIVPLVITTYHSESRTSTYFYSQTTSHYFHFRAKSPSIGAFDISNFLSSQGGLFLKVTFQVDYGKFV